MLESFKSYTLSALTTETSSKIIVPYGISGNNSVSRNGSKTDSRDINSCAQIHSLYITQRCNNKRDSLERYNPAKFSAFNIYIEDNSGYITYIVYDGRIVPGAPFFIEKNITLEPNQRLMIQCPSDSKDYNSNDNTSVTLNQEANVYLDVSASAILLQ